MRCLIAALAAFGVSPALAAPPPPLCALPGAAVVNIADHIPAPPAVALPAPSTAAPTKLPDDLAAIPFVQHVATAGAAIIDFGVAHGMRSIAARSGDGQFMLFQVAPDGRAAVSGAMADVTAEQLSAMAGDNGTEIGAQHDLRGLFVRSGAQFQVFYITPDKERVIPGVLWDADGKDLTRAQIANIPGAIPTVVVGNADPAQAGAPAAAVAALPLMQKASFGSIGASGAPQLWMLIDPQCIYSIRALQMFQTAVATGRVRLSVVPLSVLDYEDHGASTASALALLSKPADQMVTAWQNRDLVGKPSPEATTRLKANMAIAEAIQLRGTPTFVWRKKDGTEGRIDGMPNDLEALLSSIGG